MASVYLVFKINISKNMFKTNYLCLLYRQDRAIFTREWYQYYIIAYFIRKYHMYIHSIFWPELEKGKKVSKVFRWLNIFTIVTTTYIHINHLIFSLFLYPRILSAIFRSNWYLVNTILNIWHLHISVTKQILVIE